MSREIGRGVESGVSVSDIFFRTHPSTRKQQFLHERNRRTEGNMSNPRESDENRSETITQSLKASNPALKQNSNGTIHMP